jgi:hypothetical protein
MILPHPLTAPLALSAISNPPSAAKAAFLDSRLWIASVAPATLAFTGCLLQATPCNSMRGVLDARPLFFFRGLKSVVLVWLKQIN